MLEFLLRQLLMDPAHLVLVSLFLTPIVAKLIPPISGPSRSRASFLVLNLVGAFVVCVSATESVLKADSPKPECILFAAGFFTLYCLLITANWVLLKGAQRDPIRFASFSVAAPIVMLVAVKLLPILIGYLTNSHGTAGQGTHAIAMVLHTPAIFVGLSYVSFRLCYLAAEVKNGQAPFPGLVDYLSFAYFVPSLTVGPITPYSVFQRSLDSPNNSETPVGRSLARIAVGLTKNLLFGTLLGGLTYGGLLLDGHPHHVIDLFIAIVAYPLYLYCNFSGYCDMVVGTAGLMGISITENFDRPFSARNLQEFWSRWHISLTTFLREMLFTPFVKVMGRRLGPRRMKHTIALGIVTVFVVIGLWHGIGLNFLIFGLSQGIGVASVHYGGSFLKGKLSKPQLIAYSANRFIYAAGCVTTFAYFAASLFFFANTWDDARRVLACLRLG